MNAIARARIIVAILAVFVAATACKRSQPQTELQRHQLPGVPLSRLMSEPPFVGTVVESNTASVPAKDGTGLVAFLSIEVKREDGTRFAITALPATAAQVEAAKRLRPGQSYRFPEALATSPR